MSLAALLAAATSGEPTVVDPPPNLIPDAPDATIAAMRPTSRRIAQYVVDPSGAGDYTTVSAAMAAASAAQTARAASEGVSFGGTGVLPDYGVDVIIRPGTYTETVTIPSHVALYSSTGVQGDVIIRSTTGAGAALGTVVSWGPFYMEALDIVRAGGAGNNKYPHHIALADYQMGLNANVRFFSETSHATGGWTSVGMDGYGGLCVVYYGCEFRTQQTGTDLPNGGTNLHGGTYAADLRSDILFIDCLGGAVGYNALNNAVADDVWVSGGTYTAVTAQGALTDLHITGATVSGATTSQGALIANVAGMPTITGGMTQRVHEHYYGSP